MNLGERGMFAVLRNATFLDKCKGLKPSALASEAPDSPGPPPRAAVQSFRRARNETFLTRWNGKADSAPSPLRPCVFYD